jgi:hypothetical protein
VAQLKDRQRDYAQQALACFLQALRLNGPAYGATLMPRVLAMLAHNSFVSPPPLAAVMREEMAQAPPLPPATILPHVNYLVEGLLRPEREMCRWLLLQVSKLSPQSIYVPVRTSLLMLRDAVQKLYKQQQAQQSTPVKAGAAGGSTPGEAPSVSAPGEAAGDGSLTGATSGEQARPPGLCTAQRWRAVA